VKRSSFAEMPCSIARTLDVVGDPWTLLIVREAFFGAHRFSEFRERLGIPRATLSARLDLLVDHEVLARDDTGSRPGYRLTRKGRTLGPVMVALMEWGDRWSGEDEPPVTLLDDETGEPIEPVYVDARSGRPIQELQLTRRHRTPPPWAADGD
jgi:DNA-binding HxlR family transcriptional regulator